MPLLLRTVPCFKDIQGDPKKMSLSVFELKSVLDVGVMADFGLPL